MSGVITGFLCKGCGAASPVGIGYAGSPDRDTPADGCAGPHAAPETFPGVTLTCGQCGQPLTLESPLDGGENVLTCRACSVTVAYVAGTGDPGTCTP